MKNSIKKIASAAAAAALFLFTNANAQNMEPAGDSQETRLGIGLNLGLPTTDGYDFVIGGDLRLQKDFSGNVSGLLSAGYTAFTYDGGSYGFIPVKAGVKIFPVTKFYFSGELGAGFPTKDGGKTAFVWAPGIGYGLNNGVDLGLRYEGFSADGGTLGQVALRIAYGFMLR